MQEFRNNSAPYLLLIGMRIRHCFIYIWL